MYTFLQYYTIHAVAYLECAKGGVKSVWGRKSPSGVQGKSRQWGGHPEVEPFC